MSIEDLKNAKTVYQAIAAFLALSAPTYENMTDAGKNVLSKFGVSLEDFKMAGKQIEDAIKTNPEINRILSVRSRSERHKQQKLERLSKMPRSYDAYWFLEADKPQSESAHTYDAYKEIKRIRDETYSVLGKDIEESLFEFLYVDTPYSFDEAMQKAKGAQFSKEAKTRISKQRQGDYKGKVGADTLLADTARLYQLIGFNRGSIGFAVRADRQSYSNSSRTVNIGKGLTKRVLWHELAHSIEYDHPEVLEMSKVFLKKRLERSNGIRAVGDIYQNLRDRKVGNFSPSELAIDNGAFTPYVTKFYSNDPFNIDTASATEVITMGIECFTSPELLGMMAVNDPEHLEFTISVIEHVRNKFKQGGN